MTKSMDRVSANTLYPEASVMTKSGVTKETTRSLATTMYSTWTTAL